MNPSGAMIDIRSNASIVAPGRRDASIDALRAVAILLVVLGHAITSAARVSEGGVGLVSVGPNLWVPLSVTTDPLLTILYSFHMPLFAFVSGLVLYKVVPDSLSVQVRKRATGLLLPYFAWFTVTFLLAVAAGRADLGDFLSELLSVAVYPANHRALWYLHALFTAAIVLAGMRRIAGSRRWPILAMALVAAASLAIPGTREIGFLGIGNVVFVLPFLAAGYLATGARSFIAARRRLFVALGVPAFATLSVLAVYSAQTKLPIPIVGPIMSALMVWLSTVIAAVAIYALYLGVRDSVLRPQAWLGRRSLGIYATHSMFQVVLVEVFGLRIAPLLFVTSVLMSLAATLVIERIPFVKSVLLGERTRTARPADSSPSPAPSRA